jgi:hypothetical protein
MRPLAILLAVVAVIALGVAIGATPFINENLHWNVWFVVPVSGVILGCAFGWLQFRIAYLLGAPVRTTAAIGRALAAAVGYAATDVGTYATMTVEVADEEGNREGQVPLRDLMSFSDYMSVRLGSSAISMRPGRSDSPTLEMGRAGAMASLGIDLIGSFLGAFALLQFGARGAPFCHRCTRYKKRAGQTETWLAEDTAVEKMAELLEQVQGGDYASIVSGVNGLVKDAPPEKTPIKLVVDERVCDGCNEATLTGRVLRQHGNEWKEVDQLGFRIDSGTGETVRLVPAGSTPAAA